MPSWLYIVVAYLIGSISFAVVVSKLFSLPDPHSYGSGNPIHDIVYDDAAPWPDLNNRARADRQRAEHAPHKRRIAEEVLR